MTKKNKTILIVTVALAASIAVAVPIAIRYAGKPNFAKMSPRQIREYFDSNDFRDADEQTRREIREQMGEAMRARMESQVKGYFALPEERRTAYLDKIIDDMQARRAEFLEARARDPNRPPDPNRFARFGPPGADGFRPRGFRSGQEQARFGPPDANSFRRGGIQSGQERARFGPPDANGFRRFGPRGPRATNASQRRFRRPDLARMRARSERISAQARVQMMQFRRALQARMQERGIQGPMMGPGGFRRGPGFRPPG